MYEIYAQIRDQRGLTDYAVAKACGFNPTTLSDWKAGKYTPKTDKIAKIAAFLGVPIGAIMPAPSFMGMYFDTRGYSDNTAREDTPPYTAATDEKQREIQKLLRATNSASAEDIKTARIMLEALKKKDKE